MLYESNIVAYWQHFKKYPSDGNELRSSSFANGIPKLSFKKIEIFSQR